LLASIFDINTRKRFWQDVEFIISNMAIFYKKVDKKWILL